MRISHPEPFRSSEILSAYFMQIKKGKRIACASEKHNAEDNEALDLVLIIAWYPESGFLILSYANCAFRRKIQLFRRSGVISKCLSSSAIEKTWLRSAQKNTADLSTIEHFDSTTFTEFYSPIFHYRHHSGSARSSQAVADVRRSH